MSLYRIFDPSDNDDGDDPLGKVYGTGNPRDTTIQIIISLVFGIIAFLTFCFLRPRWPGLYAARKRHKNEANNLPELPDSFFGWIAPLWRISEQQVLASAGLDAYVFLAFFKMAIKFLAITLFFALVVIKPVHDSYPDDGRLYGPNGTHPSNNTRTSYHQHDLRRAVDILEHKHANHTSPGWFPGKLDTDYLWMYVAFAYLFSAIAIWLLITETRRIIEIRQEYLGTQTTVTDRTIKLSGIPPDLRDEEKLSEFIESLDMGKVERVTLCRQWKELDRAMTERMDMLRKLEEAYVIYHGVSKVERNLETLPIAQPMPPAPLISTGVDDEDEDEEATTGLINANGDHASPTDGPRPQTTIRFGRFNLHSKRVDAIDYYTEKLREADERVRALRRKDYPPTALAFVTMDSVAACQLAIQAVLDPSPLQLIANQSPSPDDVIWPNTYLSRRNRMIRQWSITILIVLLTVFWTAIFVPIAGLLGVDTIGHVLPQVGEFLDDHENIRSLVNTQLPTLFATILTVIVPYLYYYLSSHQGMIAQGDIELSAISKNFFYTFFNFFVIFTILGTASNFYQLFERFDELSRDVRMIAYYLAWSLEKLLTFYVNFIILQGVGLFPFRLLEIGSVTLYPIFLMGAKTPRGQFSPISPTIPTTPQRPELTQPTDYAELIQPPIFSYAFYLPTALLIFIISTVYSLIRSSWMILLAGLLYFLLGHFVYKYQLLYAMSHGQHSTGRAWSMICDRVFVGLVFFQLTTAGQLILKNRALRGLALLPLVVGTIWVGIGFGRSYGPLMRFLALRSVERGARYRDDLGEAEGVGEESGGEGESEGDGEGSSANEVRSERNVWADSDAEAEGNGDGDAEGAVAPSTRRRDVRKGLGSAKGDGRGSRYVNPSLVAPLEKMWIH
ncbi:hypothetical protein LTR62_006582 [Meristemomyces frigidus]|uniref:DUF221-domain-containing protein n=1 Tax=Meristemomyces frigidus TaxID=1508187 RepID=A0AAN7TN60_9PEZI|nr:hypothetical protein LTR62_006582 [Meristemomyces frigidus]